MNEIKRLREKAGLTQAQLAEKMGATQPAIALWENGMRMPRTGKLQKLAAVLGCSVDDLFKETETTA